jgi:hypothetical protein
MMCPAIRCMKLPGAVFRYTYAKGAAGSTVRRFATLDAKI